MTKLYKNAWGKSKWNKVNMSIVTVRFSVHNDKTLSSVLVWRFPLPPLVAWARGSLLRQDFWLEFQQILSDRCLCMDCITA